MKKLIKDELNIKDISQSINHNKLLYTTEETNVIKIDIAETNITSLDIGSLPELNLYRYDYIVLATTTQEGGMTVYLKQIDFE